jgi:hypothetical protein
MPSVLDPVYFGLLYGNFLPVIFPPMFDTGERLKECKGDCFPVEKIVNREINF